MICIKCQRPIDKSYGARGLAGCYCQNCAVMLGLTQEAIEKARLESVMVRTEKKIITDIRDYLVTEKGRVANSDIYILQIQAVEKFADKALADLTEYAEKLGVEL